jgi:hypothetical protein
MFDLNSKEFQGNSIFNDGVAGLTKNVEIKIEKKVGEGNTPDYKLIAKDENGQINVGFYYPGNNPAKSKEDNEKFAKQQVSRVLHIARAVMGSDYKFPQVNSAKEAYDTLFELITPHCEGKKFNVYTSYGTTTRPSKYLGFRYFNFIESADATVSRLRPNNMDLMERVEADKPVHSELDELDTSTKADENFII